MFSHLLSGQLKNPSQGVYGPSTLSSPQLWAQQESTINTINSAPAETRACLRWALSYYGFCCLGQSHIGKERVYHLTSSGSSLREVRAGTETDCGGCSSLTCCPGLAQPAFLYDPEIPPYVQHSPQVTWASLPPQTVIKKMPLHVCPQPSPMEAVLLIF